MSYYAANAPIELGVKNLVAGTYLGYRAYDTLGETVALLTAITAACQLIRVRKHEE